MSASVWSSVWFSTVCYCWSVVVECVAYLSWLCCGKSQFLVFVLKFWVIVPVSTWIDQKWELETLPLVVAASVCTLLFSCQGIVDLSSSPPTFVTYILRIKNCLNSLMAGMISHCHSHHGAHKNFLSSVKVCGIVDFVFLKRSTFHLWADFRCGNSGNFHLKQ